MKTRLVTLALATALVGCVTTTQTSVTGKNRSQLMIVPAEQVQKLSLEYFQKEKTDAGSKGKLITAGPEYDRVHRIMQRMIPQVVAFRQDAKSWGWELILVDNAEVNAHVLAGGKVTFYTGLVRSLKLSDDEIAAVMGHEMSHALREHTREKMSQGQLGELAIVAGGAAVGASNTTIQIAGLAKQLALDLPFSRHMESEADVYGVELAARSGYDPRAAITLWEKMSSAGGSRPPQFLSTHPAPESRKSDLQKLMPKVLPLYQAAGGKV